jgi:hypothetical protein
MHDAHGVLQAQASDVRQSGRDPIFGNASDMKGRRAIELISTEEFYDLLHQSEDLILIDLRPSREMKPITIPMANTLRVAPCELPDLLFWLPPASSVVLYGSLDLCLSATQAVPHLPGIAPVYMLRELDTLGDRLGSSTVENEPQEGNANQAKE